LSEAECLLSETGRMASQRVHPTRLILLQEKHMNNDGIIIGFIFEA